MRRAFGFLFLIFGLAHALAGAWLVVPTSPWFATVLWRLAVVALLAAGTGLIGVRWLDLHWRACASVGAIASLLLIAMSWHALLMIGAAIDGAILLDALPFVRQCRESWIVDRITTPRSTIHDPRSTTANESGSPLPRLPV